MSVKQMTLVWDLDLAPNKRLVLLAYADHADDEGNNVYPSLPRIAHKTGYSVDQVRRLSRELVTDGLMELVERGTGRGNTHEYRLTLQKGSKLPAFKPKQHKAKRVASAPQRVASHRKRVAPMPPEPSVTIREPSHSSGVQQEDAEAPRIDLVKVLVDDLDTLDVYLSNDEKSKYAGQIGQLRRKEVSDKRIIRGLKRLVADWDRYPHTSVQKALSFAEGNTHHSEAQEKPTQALAGSPHELVESLRNVAELKRYAPLAEKYDFTRLEKDQQPDWPIFSQLGGDDAERYRNLQRIVSRAAKANAKATCSA